MWLLACLDQGVQQPDKCAKSMHLRAGGSGHLPVAAADGQVSRDARGGIGGVERNPQAVSGEERVLPAPHYPCVCEKPQGRLAHEEEAEPEVPREQVPCQRPCQRLLPGMPLGSLQARNAEGNVWRRV